MAVSRYISLDKEVHDLLFGKTFDFAPTTLWMRMIMNELKQINGDAVCSFRTKGSNFNIITTRGKKITAFVRYSQEQRTVCVGVEKGC